MKIISPVILTWMMTFGMTSVSSADVRLPVIFSENMVLQRELPLPIWGTADSGRKSFGEFCRAVSNRHG